MNKCDLYESDADLDKLAELQDIYTQAGYEVLLVSASTGFHVEELRKRMDGKINLFIGHSGVGKLNFNKCLESITGIKNG